VAKDRRSTSYVACAPEGEKVPWKKALPGQTVTIRGISRTDFDRDLLHCIIVKAEGPRCQELTDEQILKEFEADKSGAEEKLIKGYYKGYCIVRGTITSMDASKPDSIRARLRGSDALKIEVWFEPSDPQSVEDGKTLKAGDQITVLGTAEVFGPAFNIHSARILKDE